MDQQHSITSSRKGKHLTFEERVVIQTRLEDGWKPPKIAREIGCSPNTVRNEIRRGTVLLYHGKVKRYKAKQGQKVYELHRSHCGRHFDFLSKTEFLTYVETEFQNGQSLDSIWGRSLVTGKFRADEVVCTKTLYHYVDLGLLGIKNIDLPQKVSRSSKGKQVRRSKKQLGRSIEERPQAVENRKEFGHWEADLVLGSKSGEDKVLLTLLERKSREYWIIPLASKKSSDVVAAMKNVHEQYKEHFGEVFKTITTDNGSEFSCLSNVEEWAETLVYYAHPYTSCEKGSIERANGLIRRFISKGRRIDSYSPQEIANVETWCNTLPRKILGYRTPDEVFEEELDQIYTVAA